jgi:phosphoribosylanthranilate isomerase
VTRVKICGITNLEDALTAAEAGADALGFIFVEDTPRFIAPEQAARIIRALPPFVTPVGVFWDHPPGHVKGVAEACGLRALQFHGEEKPDDLRGYGMPVIKTVKLPPPPEEAPAPGLRPFRVAPMAQVTRYWECGAAVLLDSAAKWSEGEPRRPVEWEVARQYAVHGRIILSAGLTPDNVARAVATARPYAVDVNSGVEAYPGKKDPDKVWRFVAEAKGMR